MCNFLIFFFSEATIFFSRECIILLEDKIEIVAIMWLKRGKKLKSIPIMHTSGNLEQRIIKSCFMLNDLVKYGYIHDLGLKRKECYPRDDMGLYLVNEVAFVLKDGSDFRINVNHYSKNQIRKIVKFIYDKVCIIPDGKLSSIVKDYT